MVRAKSIKAAQGDVHHVSPLAFGRVAQRALKPFDRPVKVIGLRGPAVPRVGGDPAKRAVHLAGNVDLKRFEVTRELGLIFTHAVVDDCELFVGQNL